MKSRHSPTVLIFSNATIAKLFKVKALILFLTFYVSGSHAQDTRKPGWIARASSAGLDKCEGALNFLTDAASSAIDGAEVIAGKTQEGFQLFFDKIDFEGISAGVSGGASACRALVWKSLSVSRIAKMAWRIFRFHPDVKGLRSGIFEPLTEIVNQYHSFRRESGGLDIEEKTRRQIELYGEFIAILFEVTLKAHKLIPTTVVELVPSGIGTFLPVVKTEAPESLDQLTVMFLKQFLKNAFHAVTARGLNLQDRMALLKFDLATIEAGNQFSQDAGITDLRIALEKI